MGEVQNWEMLGMRRAGRAGGSPRGQSHLGLRTQRCCCGGTAAARQVLELSLQGNPPGTPSGPETFQGRATQLPKKQRSALSPLITAERSQDTGVPMIQSGSGGGCG